MFNAEMGIANMFSKSKKTTKTATRTKKSVAWANDRGKNLERVRYVSAEGAGHRVNARERTGTKSLTPANVRKMASERRSSSIALANSDVAAARRKLEAYRGALKIVIAKQRADPTNARKKNVVQRAEKLAEEARIELEIATERARSTRLAARKNY